MNYIPTSGKFRISQSKIIRQLFLSHGLRFTTFIAAIWIILLIAGSVYDLRLIILSFMLLFIVFPAIAAFLYFFYGLQPATALNSMEHTVAISSSAIKVTLYPKNTDEESNQPELIERIFPLSKSAGYSTIEGGIIIRLSSQGFLIVPYSSFNDTEQFKEWFESLKKLF